MRDWAALQRQHFQGREFLIRPEPGRAHDACTAAQDESIPHELDFWDLLTFTQTGFALLAFCASELPAAWRREMRGLFGF